jgi:hypothetical protein
VVICWAKQFSEFFPSWKSDAGSIGTNQAKAAAMRQELA